MSRGDYDIPEVFRRAMEEAGWKPDDPGGGSEGPRRPLPPASRPPRFNKLLILSTIIILVLFSLGALASTYTDWLWFDSLGYRSMFTTQLRTRFTVFVVAFVVAFLVLGGNWWLARRNAILGTRMGTANYLGLSAVGWLVLVVAAVLSLFFAWAASGQWDTLLSYLNRVPFGIADPIFGRDVGFYVFELPVLEFVQGWLLSLLFVAALGVLPIYALNNMSEFQRGLWRPFMSPRSRTQLLILGAAFLLIWALGTWLNIYELLYSTRGVAYGASYTDMTAMLWALRIQIVLLLSLAALLLWNIHRLSVRSLVLLAGITLVISTVAGSLVPSLLQRYVVEPNELTLEEPYIRNNIAFTRAAFKLDQVESTPFGEVEDLQTQDLLDNEEMLRNIRLWDYQPLQQTYQQLQALRPYYEFARVDIDRYDIDGHSRQVMLGARELAKDRLPAPSWVNQHLEFTHGYGVIMNPVDEISPEGQPEFFIKDIPPESTIDNLAVTRPEIYYGELTKDAVYVGSDREEFDYPSGEANIYSSYAGTGGVMLDSFLKRLAFAIREGDANVLLSNDITNETRIQFQRQIQDRIRALTPFLELDADPYLVIDDGRLLWVQDAYTVSARYPYSTPIGLPPHASTTATTPAAASLPVPTRSVNYMRNAVKIVVDAYNGSVDYYNADAADPLVQTYARTYPGVFRPMSEMPEGLRSHVRYPSDYFWVQARQYLTYHMTDVRAFYNKEDLWQIPNEIFDSAQQAVEPYYISVPLPGESEPEYLLIMPFSPASKTNMIAWMAARNDGPNYGELRVFELPRQSLIFGPMQIEGRIDQDPQISQQFTLWDQRGSRVTRGNLIVLPLNNSFLYVEPVYLQSETNALPELRRIITASNTGISMQPSLESSLIALATSSFADEATAETDTTTATGSIDQTPAAQDGAVPVDPGATVESLVDQANQLLDSATEAQRNGDWALYGRELESLRLTLQQLETLTAGQ